jgi:hypothetical protein
MPQIDSAPAAARSLSILKQAEERRNSRSGTLFLDIPSWNGELIGEYQVVPREEIVELTERIARQVRSGNGSNIKPGQGDIELIIRACVGLYVIDPDTGDRVPIEDEHGHVGYDRIAEVMGRTDITSQRDTIRYLMGVRTDAAGGWKENLLAVAIHANVIARWMSDPTNRSAAMESLLGES